MASTLSIHFFASETSLVSSAHPDERLHGAGFVARLSGSTAEFISIWNIMTAGKNPFQVVDGQLCLTLQPVLPGWLFDETGQLSFRFLGHCTVIYHNPEHQDTHKKQPKQIITSTCNGETIELDTNIIKSPHAEMVRSGVITKIEVWY